MHVQELATGETRMLAVVFETGEEAIGGLRRFAEDRAMDAAQFTAIGAFRSVKLGWFDLELRDYRVNEVRSQCEVVSLIGDITLGEPGSTDPRIHAHGVVALDDARALGGHVLEAIVRPTLEVIVTEAPAVLRRRIDAATGLALLDLARSTPPDGRG